MNCNVITRVKLIWWLLYWADLISMNLSITCMYSFSLLSLSHLHSLSIMMSGRAPASVVGESCEVLRYLPGLLEVSCNKKFGFL